MHIPLPCLPIYANPKEAVQLLGLKSVRALYKHVEKGSIRGVERWGEDGLTEKGNKKKGRLMFVRSELAYIGPRMHVRGSTSEPDPDNPLNWGPLV